MSKVYQIVTDKMIAALEAGTVPWHKPWKGGAGRHVNQDGRPYRGVNPFLLDISAALNGFTSNLWLTYKNVERLGGTVTPGSKASMVVFWTRFQPKGEQPDPDTGKVKSVFVLRYYNVFNLDQTEGVKLPKRGAAAVFVPGQRDDNATVEAAEAILTAYANGPKVVHRAGAQAAYSPGLDTITLARPEDFDSDAAYYATMFHEQGHATGHVSRVGREGVTERTHFGDERYSKEELVAEMTSAFLCAESGIEATFDNSAAYIASWLKALKGDPKLVVNAAAAAQKATDFILGTTFETEEAES